MEKECIACLKPSTDFPVGRNVCRPCFNERVRDRRLARAAGKRKHRARTLKPIPMERTCTRCRKLLPITAFHRRPDRPLAFRSVCKPCDAAKQNAAYHATRARPPRAIDTPKPCNSCKLVKSIDEFYVDLAQRDKHTTRCIACLKAAAVRQRSTPRGRELGHAQGHRRRARLASVPSERFLRSEIFERDNWTCGICRGPVDRTLRYPDPMAAALDHIVPVALGGPNTRANAQCTHHVCNLKAGARSKTATN